MREIKFRAFDTTNQVMAEIDELDGDFDFIKDGDRVRSTISWQDLFNGDYPDVIAMQFTGLTDKNGKEIYESDVVEVEYGKGKVIFHAGCFMIEWIGDPEANMELLAMRNARFGHMREDLVVLGSIHENPELLNNL